MVPFFYIPSYAQVELNMSRSLSLYSIVIAQGVSVIGRLLASAAAGRVGVMIPWLTCGTLSGLLCLAWIGVQSPATFLVFAAFYGKKFYTPDIFHLHLLLFNAHYEQEASVAHSFPSRLAFSLLFVPIPKSSVRVLGWPKQSVPPLL